MQKVSIVDTSMMSDNIGDEIIMDSVNKFVLNLFPQAYIWRSPSHEHISDQSRTNIALSDVCLIGGTNILSHRIKRNGIWRFSPKDAEAYSSTKTFTVGVGWSSYSRSPDEDTGALMRKIFSTTRPQSVRDRYTQRKVEEAGCEALFTSCPTTWGLTEQHLQTIPTRPSDAVVFTLTGWRKDKASDTALIALLRQSYKKLYFFSQMIDDADYLHQLGSDGIEMLPVNLPGYDRFLETTDVDFVGTRLHGGIRALQKAKRTLIVSIDNRATEMGKDINLPTVDRAQLEDGFRKWFREDFALSLDIPFQNIAKFSEQVKNAASPPAGGPA